MKLSFRQGIARYQTDVLSTPIFLQKSSGAGTFIDLIVSPDPTVLVFAHHDANYIVEEVRTVANAWGPFTTSATPYLYWDINLLTGVVSRGATLLPPIYSGVQPNGPANDQHWFDTAGTAMYVWNGNKWVEKIRVFAGFLSSGAIIHPNGLGSQAGIVGDYEGGNLILDAYNKPIRTSDGSFLTSVSSLLIVNNSAKKVQFETEVMTGMAAEPVPMFSLVQMRPGRRIILARHTDYLSRIAGVVTEDLYTNEVGYVVNDGLIRNEAWAWPADKINRPVFCGPNGEITTVPPTMGVIQVAGFVYDTDAIYVNIFPPIILEDITNYIAPPAPPPPVGAPIANFVANVVTGPAPLTVNFMSTSLGSPTSFEWDFTNDNTVDGAGPTISYTYETPGTYNVRLRAINGFGTDDEIKTGFIVVQQAPFTGSYTNLGIRLGGPSQVLRAQTFQMSITISNDGFLTATNVARVITIADIKGQQATVSGLPPGAVVTRDTNRTIVTLPLLPTLATGLTYGPVMFNITAPGKTGSLSITATVASPEVDATIGDNTTALAVEVKP